MRRVLILTGLVVAACAMSACGGASGPRAASNPSHGSSVPPSSAPNGSSSTSSPPPTTAVAQPAHVMVVMMENKSFDEVIGQSSQPFTNGLADRYGLATQSYAFGHPSLPNYIDLVSGSSQGVTDDDPPSSHAFPGRPTLADQLAAAGVPERAYAENLPSDPTADKGSYAVRHFPWTYFPGTRISFADGGSLLSDLRSARPPDFVWYTPDVVNDEHDGTVEQGDAFLASLIPAVQATPWYRDGGQIIVEWDESDGSSEGINGSSGGHVPTIVVSAALAASPRQDRTPVDTAGILASIERCYGVPLLGGAADPANGNIDGLLSCPRR